MAIGPPPSEPAQLPQLSEEAVRVRMMRELFTRTRESALVGVLPVLLIVWSHWGAQPTTRLLFWATCLWALLAYRIVIAHLFLSRPLEQEQRRPLWFRLEWLGSMGVAAMWVGSISMIGTGTVDALFFLRLIFIIALVSFVLSAIGIEMRLYAGFMTVVVGGTLLLLHRDYPGFIRDLPAVNVAIVVYAVMLLVRSRGEQRRAQEWVRARLTQRLLLDQLNQNIRQELLMHEALRMKSLEQESSNRKLGELAVRDGLTQAMGRSHIEGELRRLVKGVQRKPGDFSVQLLDIDLFARVNDQHGHAVGDEVLRRVALLVQETIRGSDLFGRWGGEEFIVLLPDTALPQALEAAERLRLVIQRQEFAGEDGMVFNITVSIGVAQFEFDERADAVTQRAAKALAAAKRGGRNRVRAYEPGQSELMPLLQ